MNCYILDYTRDNVFYKHDIIGVLIRNGVPKDKLVVFKEDAIIELKDDDIKVKKVNFEMEVECEEYYKCKYSEDIDVYINEYNMIIKGVEENNILQMISEEPLIIFL